MNETMDNYVMAVLWGNNPVVFGYLVKEFGNDEQLRKEFRQTNEYKRVVKDLNKTNRKGWTWKQAGEFAIGIAIGYTAIEVCKRIMK